MPSAESKDINDCIKKVITNGNIPNHVAIIMDGNRRWAKSNSMTSSDGHLEGVNRIAPIVKMADKLGVKFITFFAFSVDNWNRQESEKNTLMKLFDDYLKKDILSLSKDAKINFMGSRARFSDSIINGMNKVEKLTEENKGINVIFAVNYGGKEEIVFAVKNLCKKVLEKRIDLDNIDSIAFSENTYLPNLPAPDLLIRTGGEKRISNFMLWHIGYSELFFSDLMWPVFSEYFFLQSVLDYQLRDRRYGSS